MFKSKSPQIKLICPAFLTGDLITNQIQIFCQEPDYPVEKEGYLMKQGGGTFSSDWRRRWFVLKGPNLYYYKDLKDKQPAGLINVLAAEIGLVKDRKKVGGKDFCFQIETKERVYYCWANTSSEMDSWVNCLIDVKEKYAPNALDSGSPSFEKKSLKRNLTNPFFQKKEPLGRKNTLFSGRLSLEKGKSEEAKSSSPSSGTEMIEEDEEEEESEEPIDKVLIIDTGTGTTKVGWSGEMEPILVFPTVVATYGEIYKVGKFSITEEEVKEKYKKKISQKRNVTNAPVFKLIYPMENGVVRDWDAMTRVFEYIFRTLKIRKRIQKMSVLLSEPPANPKTNKEMMVDLLFKRFKVSELYIAPQPVLALFSSGRTAGIVLDCGEGMTQVVPVFDGYIIESAIKKVPWAGKQITEAMMKALVERGYSFHNEADREVAREIKEELCYIALDLGKELTSQNIDRSYTPSNKNVVGTNPSQIYETVVLGPERFMIPEGLFKPTQVGQEGEGVAGLIVASIKETSMDLRKTFYENIVLCGGSTLFTNFERRVEKDLKVAIGAANVKPVIIAPPDRQYSVWLGGACFASLDTFTAQCLTREDYEAEGLAVVHEKFKGFA